MNELTREALYAQVWSRTWYAEDFARYRAVNIRSTTPEGNDAILVLINGLRTKPSDDFTFSASLADEVAGRLPEVAKIGP